MAVAAALIASLLVQFRSILDRRRLIPIDLRLLLSCCFLVLGKIISRVDLQRVEREMVVIDGWLLPLAGDISVVAGQLEKEGDKAT